MERDSTYDEWTRQAARVDMYLEDFRPRPRPVLPPPPTPPATMNKGRMAELPPEIVAEVHETIDAILADEAIPGTISGKLISGVAELDVCDSPGEYAKALGQARQAIEIVRLRKKGYGLAEIASQLGIVNREGKPKTSTVHDILTRTLKNWMREDVEDLRTIELERLDEITVRVWKIIEREGGKGDDDRALRAIDRYMQVSARRAALTGLDMPKAQVFKGEVAVENRTTVHIEMVEAVNEYLGLVDEIVAEEIKRATAIQAIDATSTIVEESQPVEGE